MTALYTLSNILQRYNGRPVLSVDSLSIEPGSITGVVGANGSGKSTLMRLLAFLETPECGTIHFDGELAVGQRKNGSRLVEMRKHATLLTQEPYLLRRTVAENVAYGLHVRGVVNTAPLVAKALEEVGLVPAEFMRRQWYELSGGEAQRVALAARIALAPRVLLMDEPTSSLDEESADRIRAASLHMRETNGTTLIIVSHDREWLSSIADAMIVLRKGELQGESH